MLFCCALEIALTAILFFSLFLFLLLVLKGEVGAAVILHASITDE